MEKIRAALIGCGHIHSLHTRAIAVLPDVEIVAVCDEIRERAEKTAAEFSCRVYTDWKEMCECDDIDVIHIATPHYLHAPMTIYALEHGKHVLTEKPMAIKYEDAEAMNEAARRTGNTLGVIFQNRTNPGSVLVKETLESGKLGKVKCAKCALYWDRPDSYYAKDNWHGTWEREGGGVIINQAIHTLDLLRWFMDEEIDFVEANIANRTHPTIEVEDMAEGIIVYKNGVRTMFHLVNYYGENENITIDILCEKGKIHMEAAKATVTFEDGSVIEKDNESVPGPTVPGKGYWGVGHYKQVADFYESIKKGEMPALSGEEAIKTQKMICALYQSGKTGQRVQL